MIEKETISVGKIAAAIDTVYCLGKLSYSSPVEKARNEAIILLAKEGIKKYEKSYQRLSLSTWKA